MKKPNKWEIAASMAAVVGALVGLGGCWQGYKAEQRAERAEERQRIAELDAKMNKEALTQKNKELAEHADVIELFILHYPRLLNATEMALSRYNETKRPADLESARTTAQALIDLVKKYRELAKQLQERLNGQITALEGALRQADDSQFADLIRKLRLNADSDLALLVQLLQKLRAEMLSGIATGR
jgi:hypothetical protein